MPFDHVVSLGAWCQTAYQIKQQQQNLLPSCFDWLVTPWDALISILEDDGAKLGLKVAYDHYSKTIKCQHYGVLYAHEFKPDQSGIPYVSEENLGQCRAKLLHKYRKMFDAILNGGTTLFVRFGGTAEPAAAWPYLAQGNPRSEDDLNELMLLLRRKFPAAHAKLLFIWQDQFSDHNLDNSKLDRDILTLSLPRPVQARWMGEDGPWSEVFRGAEVAFFATGERNFSVGI